MARSIGQGARIISARRQQRPHSWCHAATHRQVGVATLPVRAASCLHPQGVSAGYFGLVPSARCVSGAASRRGGAWRRAPRAVCCREAQRLRMASRALQRALAAPAPCDARLFGGRVRRYTDGVPGRGAIRRRRVCAASGEGFGRRGAFAASLSAAAVAATACPAVADEDYNVRLKDVEDARTRAAVEAAARGDEALAEQLFRQVTETDPGLASAWSNLGNIQVRARRLGTMP